MAEFKNLLGSVKAWFNEPHEVNLRIREQEDGLSESESQMVQFLPHQSRILDIGCATGRTSFALAEKGHVVTGIDIAELLIEKARTVAEKRGIAITYQVCDPVTLPFPDSVFDAALLLKTYCYVPKRQNRIAWLNEIARVLKPNSWLLLSQYIIDEALGSYEPIHKENQRRFPSIYTKLEKGDGFSLPVEDNEMVAFIHYFMEVDLRAELESSPFQIISSFRENVMFYCTLKQTLKD